MSCWFESKIGSSLLVLLSRLLEPFLHPLSRLQLQGFQVDELSLEIGNALIDRHLRVPHRCRRR